jgi:hypothetical protein
MTTYQDLPDSLVNQLSPQHIQAKLSHYAQRRVPDGTNVIVMDENTKIWRCFSRYRSAWHEIPTRVATVEDLPTQFPINTGRVCQVEATQDYYALTMREGSVYNALTYRADDWLPGGKHVFWEKIMTIIDVDGLCIDQLRNSNDVIAADINGSKVLLRRS